MSAARPLSNLQQELLKIYGSNVSDADLIHIRNYLKNYFAGRAISETEDKNKLQETAGLYLSNAAMSNPSIQPPLSNIQAELLKLFSANIPDNDLLELKKMMAKFLLEKARNNADKTWDEKGYTDDKLQQILKD